MLSVFVQAQQKNLTGQKSAVSTDNCLSHPKSLYNWKEIETTFSQHLSITTTQSKSFFRYAAKWGYLKMEDYYLAVKNGSINKNNAQQYWLTKLPYFESLYTATYLSFLEKEKAEAEKNKVGLSTKTMGSSCNNLDFSSGDLTGWTGKWNNVPGAAGTGIYGGLTVTGLNTNGLNSMNYVHEICTGGYDPHVPISCVPPGYNYALRLGNDSAYELSLEASTPYPYNHQTISNTFSVTISTQIISFWYAVVLDQSTLVPHPVTQQPFFTINIYDSTGAEVMCVNYDVNLSIASAIGDYKDVIDPSGQYDFRYKNWSQVLIPLSSYIGQNVTLTFQTSDCANGGHFGYAYIAGNCNPNNIITASTPLCTGGTTTLFGPDGMAHYAWAGPVTDTTQNIITNTPGNYTLTTTSTSSCSIPPLYYNLTQNATSVPTIGIHATKDSICNGLTDTLTANGATTYTWNIGATTNSVSVSPANITIYTVTGTDINTGCVNTATQTIYVTNCTAAGIQEIAVINDGFKVYPNPANEMLTVAGLAKNSMLYINDMLGNKIKEVNVESELTNIDISNLNNGMYFLNVQTASHILTKKIIIQR